MVFQYLLLVMVWGKVVNIEYFVVVMGYCSSCSCCLLRLLAPIYPIGFEAVLRGIFFGALFSEHLVPILHYFAFLGNLLRGRDGL